MNDDIKHSRERIFFIVNPISGSGRQRKIGRVIEKCLDKSRFSYKIIFTEAKGHAIRLARQAVQEGASVVVAVGGDGTVNEVGQGVVDTRTALAIIPTGSGNGLARHLGLPMHFRKAIEVINRGNRIQIDTATLNDAFFVNMAGIGFDAHVARKFDRAHRRGFFSYFLIVITSYSRYRPSKYELTIDGKQLTQRALMISFANSTQFGNNTTIAPQASVNDGLLDVCIVRKLPFWKIFLLSPLIFLKKADKIPLLEIIKAKEIIVRRKKGKYVHLDGDPDKQGKTLLVKVHPLSLQIIVP